MHKFGEYRYNSHVVSDWRGSADDNVVSGAGRIEMLPLKTAARFLLKLVEHRTGRMLPVACSYLVTSSCNLHCAGCSFDRMFRGVDRRGSDDELGTADALELIRGFARIRTPMLIIAGGEPLLREDLFDLSAASRAGGMFTILITNGTLLDYDNIADIETGFHRCVVSIDGTERANDIIRGEGSYAKAVAGVGRLLEKRKRIPVIIACVVNRHNMDTLPQFVEEMKSIGVDGVKFQLNYLPELQPGAEEAAAGLPALLDMKRKHPRFVVGPESFLTGMVAYLCGGSDAGCIAESAAHIVISPAGVFSLCCFYPSELRTVRRASDLMEHNRSEYRTILSGCKGCYRHDEHVLADLLDAPLSKICWKEAFENIII